MVRSSSDRALRVLLCELLQLFYAKAWTSGTGGGLCIASGTPAAGILMAPTGAHKEHVRPQDLFVVDRRSGTILRAPRDPALHPSECSPIFLTILTQRTAGSVMHSHALSAVLAGDLAGSTGRLSIQGLEMLKGLRGVSNQDEHLIPVIQNTASEADLVVQIREVLEKPEFAPTYAVLVRHHGAYIWGADAWEAKRHAEVYHFLFEASVARTHRNRAGG